MNVLQKGMHFDSYKDICNFTGIKYDSHKSFLIERIHKICSTHIENNKIIIDDVFGNANDIKYQNHNYFYEAEDIVSTKTGKIKIIKQIRLYGKSKGYQYICVKDGYTGEISEYHLKNGVGCPICGKAKCVNGLNSIYDVRKDLLKYIVNKNDAHNYTPCSGKKVLCKCPTCGYEKIVTLHNLSSHGFSCNFCSDGLSYPNKFVYCLLNQLNINYTPEKIFDWCTNKLYDIYIPSLNMIIENHGKQHYIKTGFSSLGGRNLQEEQENDLFKYNTAINNGISHYIMVDCKKSDLNYIKESIMSTTLPTLLGFSENDVNWKLCHEYALKPIIKDVCKFWETHNKNITYVKEYFHMDIHTIMEYLEKGAKIGCCSYEKGNNDSRRFAMKQLNSKPIYNPENNIYFFSQNECETYFKDKFKDETFSGSGLYTYINNSQKYHNNTFVYVSKNEYNMQKKII